MTYVNQMLLESTQRLRINFRHAQIIILASFIGLKNLIKLCKMLPLYFFITLFKYVYIVSQARTELENCKSYEESS